MNIDERIELLKAHLSEPIPGTWDEPFHRAWLAAEGDAECVRFAKAHAAEMAAVRPVIKPGELIIGNKALRPIVTGMHIAFAYGIQMDHGRLAELRESQPDAAEELDAIETYWATWMADSEYCAPMAMHAALAYELFLERGVDGMREHVRHWQAANAPKSAEWYEALLITLDGVTAFIEAHAQAAKAEGLDDIANACQHIARGAPRTFHEAVQLAYLMFWLNGHDSPGPVDRYLYPALKRDLDAGTTTLEEAQELIYCLWLKFEEKTAYGVTIAGQLPDGSDACNELTHLCLEATRRLRLLSPRTAFRWHPNVSEDALSHAIDVIASGASFPALINDEALIAAAVERGIALEHAREYSFVGCGQTYPVGRGHGDYEDIVANSAKPLELALNNGIDPVSGNRMGPETGEAESFSTYDEFFGAYREQMDQHIGTQIEHVNAHRRKHVGRWYAPMRSLVTYGCVERGLDWHEGGADYSEGQIDMVGLTTTTDSLVAIRKAVFEEGLVGLGELRDVLNSDWEDAEALRKYMLARLPKFGNDDPEADGTMVEELDRINRFIKSHRTVFDGPWGMDIIGWSGAMELGSQTGATPDGRRKFESLADCAGPAQGRNVKGLTTTLHSMMKLPHDEVHGPLVLSLRFPKSAVATDEGKAKMRAVAESYLEGGGQDLQISIASTEEMRAAQLNPEAHRDLVVRVGGFSAYFIHLERRFQDDVISRSEAIV